MTTFEDAWAAIEGIDGWLSEGQARVLFDAAVACPTPGRIVEIGSFRGRSTIVLALGAPAGVEVIAIDPHAGNDRGPRQIAGYVAAAAGDHARFAENLERAGVADRVRHRRVRSADALAEVEGAVDVLYIDGAHRYGPARSDIVGWGARVADGGTMLVHDAFSSIGVTAAILRRLVWSRRFRYRGRSRSLVTYRADGEGGRLPNAARQVAQLPWFVRNVVVKVLITARVLRSTEWPY